MTENMFNFITSLRHRNGGVSVERDALYHRILVDGETLNAKLCRDAGQDYSNVYKAIKDYRELETQVVAAWGDL